MATLQDAEGKIACELLDGFDTIVDRPGFSFWYFHEFSYEEVILKREG